MSFVRFMTSPIEIDNYNVLENASSAAKFNWRVACHNSFCDYFGTIPLCGSGLCVIELPAMLHIQAIHTSGSPSPAANSAACHEDARVKRHGGTHARGGGEGESGCDDQPEGLGEWHDAALGDQCNRVESAAMRQVLK
jgi:hypothetical protein